MTTLNLVSSIQLCSVVTYIILLCHTNFNLNFESQDHLSISFYNTDVTTSVTISVVPRHTGDRHAIFFCSWCRKLKLNKSKRWVFPFLWSVKWARYAHFLGTLSMYVCYLESRISMQELWYSVTEGTHINSLGILSTLWFFRILILLDFMMQSITLTRFPCLLTVLLWLRLLCNSIDVDEDGNRVWPTLLHLRRLPISRINTYDMCPHYVEQDNLCKWSSDILSLSTMSRILAMLVWLSVFVWHLSSSRWYLFRSYSWFCHGDTIYTWVMLRFWFLTRSL